MRCARFASLAPEHGGRLNINPPAPCQWQAPVQTKTQRKWPGQQSGNSQRFWSSGPTSKNNSFFEEGSFFSRIGAKFFWEVFYGGLLFGGVFVLLRGVFVFLGVFFVFRDFFWGELIFDIQLHQNGEFPLCRPIKTRGSLANGRTVEGARQR